MEAAKRAVHIAEGSVVDNPEQCIGDDGWIVSAVAGFARGGDHFQEIGRIIEIECFLRRYAFAANSPFQNAVGGFGFNYAWHSHKVIN